jgi:hypothetical protein
MTGPIKAGSWHLVGDGIVLYPVDITFAVLWRDAAGEHPIASFTHHFDPPSAGFDAVQYEDDAIGVAAKAKPNDTLILRMTAADGGQPADTMLWIPNGDAEKTKGRDPSLTLPK